MIIIRILYFLVFMFFSCGQLYARVAVADTTLAQQGAVCASEKIFTKDRSEWIIEYMAGDKVLSKQFRFADGTENVLGVVPDGYMRVFYETGQLMKKFYLNGNKRQGIAFYYFRNGKVFREMNYAAGKLQGFVKEYYLSGKLKFLEVWDNDKLDGIKVVYSSDGKLIKRLIYKNGLLHGLCVFIKDGEKRVVFFQNGISI